MAGHAVQLHLEHVLLREHYKHVNEKKKLSALHHTQHYELLQSSKAGPILIISTVEFLHLTTNLLARLAASMSTTVPVKNILTKKKCLPLAYTRPKKKKKKERAFYQTCHK